MRFIKGIVVGSMITAGAMILCSNEIDDSKRKMIRKGKQFMRKIKI